MLFPNEPRGGVAGAGEEPQSLLLPQAPPTNGPDVTPRERFRASVAVTVRLAKASETAARKARPAPKPAQLRPAPHIPPVRSVSRPPCSVPPASLL